MRKARENGARDRIFHFVVCWVNEVGALRAGTTAEGACCDARCIVARASKISTIRNCSVARFRKWREWNEAAFTVHSYGAS